MFQLRDVYAHGNLFKRLLQHIQNNTLQVLSFEDGNLLCTFRIIAML
jgi:hypothetical protein